MDGVPHADPLVEPSAGNWEWHLTPDLLNVSHPCPGESSQGELTYVEQP